MRPEILYPLFRPLTTLAGVGPRIGESLKSLLGGSHVVDLLWHLPTGFVDRRREAPVAEAPEGEVVTLTVTIDRHHPPPRKPLPYRIEAHDGSGVIELIYFHGRKDWLESLLPPGTQRIVSGRIERYRGSARMAHPDRVAPVSARDEVAILEPVYPMNQGVPARTLVKLIGQALELAPGLAEWQDQALLAREGWPGWKDALLAAHAPSAAPDLLPQNPARRRLAYDELLANQLAMALMRRHMRLQAGRPSASDGRLRNRALAAFGHPLTGSQTRVLEAILADMARPIRMLRLLQGDVGSGKTIVAALAMLEAIGAGRQAALMAPSEILARQHHATLAPLFEAAGVRLAMLTGRHRGARRDACLADLAEGRLHGIVGTHALIQEDVRFHDLGLAVVDEQHRFGVDQRLRLGAKGRGTDILVMTATPIPRTLTLMAYGDLDVSRLDEKPAGRLPIDTRTIPLSRQEEVIAAIGRAIGMPLDAKGGRQGPAPSSSSDERVFWVCPLVSESETLDVAAAEARAVELASRFPGCVGLVHGKLKAQARDAAMADFISGRRRILVATTVVEVGVDVPEATVMVIEHAERFGLAQLHQLRGRIGRGGARSTCILLYATPLGEAARQRLAILRETDDGFRIAEEDLRLRGAGEILGTRQSGLPVFRLVDLAAHAGLMEMARDEAALILHRDPDLTGSRGEALRGLLYLFSCDSAVQYARSG